MVDFVIVYETTCGPSELGLTTLSQNTYDQHSIASKITDLLLENNLHVTYETVPGYEITTQTPIQIHYVKITATDRFLKDTAERHRIRIPVNEVDVKADEHTSMIYRLFSKPSGNQIKFMHKYFYSVRFLRQLEHIYNVRTSDGSIFTETQRINLIWKTLESLTIQAEDLETNQMVKTSIQELLQNKVLSAVYPIHDSHHTSNSKEVPKSPHCDKRSILHNTWAKFSRWRHPQPLDNINYYFGNQTAIYFAFLGFYTKLLFIPSIFALISLACGIFSGYTDQTAKDICHLTNETLCPLCDPLASWCVVYTRLNELCSDTKISAVVDNPFNIVYGFLTCLWCTVLIELWKRRELQLACRWGTVNSGLSHFNVRTEFINKYKKPGTSFVPDIVGHSKKSGEAIVQLDANTSLHLWSLSAVKRSTYFLKIICSVLCVMIFIIVALCCAAGSIFLRISFRTKITDDAAEYTTTEWQKEFLLRNASTIGSVLASIISAVVMLILNAIYAKVAKRLNDFECLRTEQEYEKSFVYKFFVFQFINFFAGIFYTTFLKDAVGHIFLTREACATNGCVADICIQLLITMSIKQVFNNFMELFNPAMQRRFKKFKEKLKAFKQKTKHNIRHIKDYYLIEIEKPILYIEYLELSIQYAFVTLFATICPPTAILALVNNIFEIRIDARKMTKYYRRPVSIPANSIGPWISVFTFITRAAVLTNACLVAFGGTFVEKMVLKFYFNADLVGNRTVNYVDFAFRIVETQAIEQMLGVNFLDVNQTQMTSTCRVRNYKNLKWNEENEAYWESNLTWWIILAAKLIFVIAYEKVVTLIQLLIMGLIPDLPDYVKIRHEREQYLEQEALMQTHKNDSEKPINSSTKETLKRRKRKKFVERIQQKRQLEKDLHPHPHYDKNVWKLNRRLKETKLHQELSRNSRHMINTKSTV